MLHTFEADARYAKLQCTGWMVLYNGMDHKGESHWSSFFAECTSVFGRGFLAGLMIRMRS